MKKFKEIFVCDQCGFESDNPFHFREFMGNEMIPSNPVMGVIGNNLWDIQKTQIPQQIKDAIQKKELTVFNHNNTFIITSTTVCLNCAIKTQLLSLIQDKNNRYSAGEMRKYEIGILTKILRELGVDVYNPLEAKNDSVEQMEYTDEEDDEIIIEDEDSTNELPDFSNAFQKRLDVHVKNQEEK